MKTLKLLFLFSVMTFASFAQQPPLEPGVSQTLARWRAAHYSDVRYKLNITLEKGAPLMKGEIEIRVKLTDEGAQNNLILDWRTTQFDNDKNKPYAMSSPSMVKQPEARLRAAAIRSVTGLKRSI